MKKSLIAVFVFGLLLSSASSQEAEGTLNSEGVRKGDLTRQVPSGKTRTIWFVHAANPDCSVMGEIEVRVTKPPEHGNVDIVPGENYSRFAKDNPRSKCNEKKMRGFNVNYKSSSGYTGSDQFEILVLWPNGLADEVNYKVNVR